MRNRPTFFLFAALLILALTACGQTTPETQKILFVNTIAVTKTATVTATMTPTRTSVMVTTSTPIAIPTLPKEDASARLLDLLANNGGCRLPCVWGITPGKSTYQEAQAILMPLSSISIFTDFVAQTGVIHTWYKEDELILSTAVVFYVDIDSNDQIITKLTFKAEELKELSDGGRGSIYDSKTFGERVRPYMLSEVLSQLGKPDLVEVQTYGRQITGTGGFEMVLLYPNQGVLVHYVTQMQTAGGNAKGCLTNAKVEMEIYPSGNADSFVKALSNTLIWAIFVKEEPVDNLSWKPIDKATSMSLEQFYETFRESNDKCIETPMKIWATPEDFH